MDSYKYTTTHRLFIGGVEVKEDNLGKLPAHVLEASIKSKRVKLNKTNKTKDGTKHDIGRSASKETKA